MGTVYAFTKNYSECVKLRIMDLSLSIELHFKVGTIL